MIARTRQFRWRRGAWVALCCLPLCASLPGCTLNNWVSQHNPWQRPAPCALSPQVSKEQLVAHLNANTDRVQAWRSNDVRIKPEGAMSLGAKVAVESPRNFRLVASSPMSEEIDLGSNGDLFWYWARLDPSKGVFYARHEEMDRVQQNLPIPFEPAWLMEVLGVVRIDDAEAAEMLLQRGTDSNLVSLVSNRFSPAGLPVQRVLIIDACYGRIVAHELHDAQGNLIARAELQLFQTDKVSGVTMPHDVHLYWPQANMSLGIRLGAIEINPTNVAPAMWQMPEKNNCPLRNLAGGARRPRPLAQAHSLQFGEFTPRRVEQPAPIPSDDNLMPAGTARVTSDENFDEPPNQGDAAPAGKARIGDWGRTPSR